MNQEKDIFFQYILGADRRCGIERICNGHSHIDGVASDKRGCARGFHVTINETGFAKGDRLAAFDRLGVIVRQKEIVRGRIVGQQRHMAGQRGRYRRGSQRKRANER